MKKPNHTKNSDARGVDSINSEINKANQSNEAVSNETAKPNQKSVKEYGGRKDGLDPTRYGDWEKNGRCIDF